MYIYIYIYILTYVYTYMDTATYLYIYRERETWIYLYNVIYTEHTYIYIYILYMSDTGSMGDVASTGCCACSDAANELTAKDLGPGRFVSQEPSYPHDGSH